ncbi:hypothetical protein [Egicoccus halophilus]|uniref:Uncharacterized protein n=1 Tax=Egicoccus halophilus TaxID=1670830 RepID=A0A8J3EUZ5_9ACTN|nr:hypothetical protein [Egicoccus halophilus]GGI08170.1 hypothetical protein GCM10011354_27750 [Egicoccus halophilus]
MSTFARTRDRWSLRLGPARRRPPAPRPAVVDLGPTLPAWTLRVACVVVAGACTVPLLPAAPLAWFAVGALLVTVAVRPGGAGPSLLAVGVGLLWALAPTAPFAWPLFALVSGVHLVVDLAALHGDLAVGGRVERRVLRRAAGAWLAVQVPIQALALVARQLHVADIASPWPPLAAGVGLAVLAWALLRTVRARG